MADQEITAPAGKLDMQQSLSEIAGLGLPDSDPPVVVRSQTSPETEQVKPAEEAADKASAEEVEETKPGEGPDDTAKQEAVTFDSEVDKKNGYDIDSPEYKKFQADFTKLRQKDKKRESAEVLELREKLAKLEGRMDQQSTEQATTQSVDLYKVDLSSAPMRKPVSELFPDAEDAQGFVGVVEDLIQHAVTQIVTQSQAEQQRAAEADNQRSAKALLTQIQNEPDADLLVAVMQVEVNRDPSLSSRPNDLLKKAKQQLSSRIKPVEQGEVADPRELQRRATEQLRSRASDAISRPTVPASTAPVIRPGTMDVRAGIRKAIADAGIQD